MFENVNTFADHSPSIMKFGTEISSINHCNLCPVYAGLSAVELCLAACCGFVLACLLWICVWLCTVDLFWTACCGFVCGCVLWICFGLCAVDLCLAMCCGFVLTRVLWICIWLRAVDLCLVVYCGVNSNLLKSKWNLMLSRLSLQSTDM